MARGGYRPGAGRPPGATKRMAPAAIRAEAGAAGLDPLAYLLRLVADEHAPTEIRLRAAAIALPYVHARAGERGKRAREADMARSAERGTDWEALLQ